MQQSLCFNNTGLKMNVEVIRFVQMCVLVPSCPLADGELRSDSPSLVKRAWKSLISVRDRET